MYFLDPCSLELQCFSLKNNKRKENDTHDIGTGRLHSACKWNYTYYEGCIFPHEKSWKVEKMPCRKLCAGVMIFSCAQLRWQVRFRWAVSLGAFSPHQQSSPLCDSVFNGSFVLPQARDTFRQWKIQSSPLCACEDKPFCLSCQSMVSLNYLRRSIFNDRMLLAWNLSCGLSWDFSLGYFLCLQPSLSGSRPWRTQPWP